MERTLTVLPHELIAIRDATNWGGPNRPGLPMTPRWITVHETANPNPGANAEMHRRFVWGGGGDEGVSFQYVVDDHEVVQMIPDREAAWHAGDGYWGTGNRQSIGIETCINVDGDWEQTKHHLARLVARKMLEHSIPLERVVQHNHWSGKDCPHILRLPPPQWNALLTQVQSYVDMVRNTPATDPNAYQDPLTGYWVINLPDAPILTFWRAGGGVATYGRPLSGMTQDAGVYSQLFENCVLESWPNGFGSQPGPHVRMGGLGQRYLRLIEGETA